MTLLAVYFIFILDNRNDVRQKANSSNFFNLNSKWVVKQWRQLATSTMHLAQELLTAKCRVQWWFEKFCKGDKSLEDEECRGWPSEVDKDQLRGSSKLDPLTIT